MSGWQRKTRQSLAGLLRRVADAVDAPLSKPPPLRLESPLEAEQVDRRRPFGPDEGPPEHWMNMVRDRAPHMLAGGAPEPLVPPPEPSRPEQDYPTTLEEMMAEAMQDSMQSAPPTPRAPTVDPQEVPFGPITRDQGPPRSWLQSVSGRAPHLAAPTEAPPPPAADIAGPPPFEAPSAPMPPENADEPPPVAPIRAVRAVRASEAQASGDQHWGPPPTTESAPVLSAPRSAELHGPSRPAPGRFQIASTRVPPRPDRAADPAPFVTNRSSERPRSTSNGFVPTVVRDAPDARTYSGHPAVPPAGRSVRTTQAQQAQSAPPPSIVSVPPPPRSEPFSRPTTDRVGPRRPSPAQTPVVRVPTGPIRHMGASDAAPAARAADRSVSGRARPAFVVSTPAQPAPVSFPGTERVRPIASMPAELPGPWPEPAAQPRIVDTSREDLLRTVERHERLMREQAGE